MLAQVNVVGHRETGYTLGKGKAGSSSTRNRRGQNRKTNGGVGRIKVQLKKQNQTHFKDARKETLEYCLGLGLKDGGAQRKPRGINQNRRKNAVVSADPEGNWVMVRHREELCPQEKRAGSMGRTVECRERQPSPPEPDEEN